LGRREKKRGKIARRKRGKGRGKGRYPRAGWGTEKREKGKQGARKGERAR